MMKNGRPYSNENGYVDDGLITSHPQDEIDAVMSWIAESIYPLKTPLHGHTSYGIKHLLERDTGIYLTQNTSSRSLNGHSSRSIRTRAFRH